MLSLSLLGQSISVSASQYEIDQIQREQDATQSEINSLNEEKKQAQDNVNNLQSEANELQGQYDSYSSRLQSVNAQITSARSSLASTSQEIVKLSQELTLTEAALKEQKELMSLHIKYMYENQSKSTLITYLFSAGSLRDFLTKAEYVSAIMNSDKEVFDAYQELSDTIASKSESLSKKQEELEGYQSTLTAKQSELDTLTTSTGQSLDAKNSEVDSAEAKLAEYNTKLAELDQKMQSLQSAAAEAQAALAQAIAEKQAKMAELGLIEDTSGAYSYQYSDLVYLAACIQAEAGGESYQGQLAVGSVIMNRVMSSLFPDTVQGVIQQKGQFASYTSGKVDLIASNGPSDTCLQAAQEVLNGTRIGNWFFFMTQACADGYGITGYTMIGNHAFFYKWGAN